MSAENIPYHLRTNKAVERQIFFELLAKLKLETPIRDYQYVSLGGPMLEDHNIMHSQLGLEDLVSIEKNSSTYSRQLFNLPFNCITCLNQTISEYIDSFESEKNNIIWLDYTAPSWGDQLNEIYSIATKLKPFDILKVTFNASPRVLKSPKNDESEIFKNKCYVKYRPNNININNLKTEKNFPLVLLQAIKNTIDDALAGDDLEFIPLSSFRYKDATHQMMTVTGLFLSDSDDLDSITEESGIKNWEHLNSRWDSINNIDIPDLTIKERLQINNKAPTKEINLDDLGFSLDSRHEAFEEKVLNYLKYYRYIPFFNRSLI